MLKNSFGVFLEVSEIINVGLWRKMQNVELVDMFRVVLEEESQIVSVKSIKLQGFDCRLHQLI